MLPGASTPIMNWRPTSGGYSKEDYQEPASIVSARDLAQKGGISEDNYLDYYINKANQGDESAIQYLADYWSTKKANELAAYREDHAWSILNDDLKRAGISPYVMSSATPMVSSASSRVHTGSDMASTSNNKRTSSANELRGVLMALGIMFSAVMHAL